MTITRIWHGKTKLQDADVYLQYVMQTGMADYTSIEGNISAKVLRRVEGDVCHFVTISEWENYEAIMRFAGDNFEKARYYDEDKKYLLEFEESVIHYETYS